MKGKTLGRAAKRRYDLPLGGDGAGFLTVLIGLMTVLAMMALCASFVLAAMTARWSSGLENRITVEIPARTRDGALLDADAIASLTDKIAAALRTADGVVEVVPMDRAAIAALVDPWLGQGVLNDDFPLPGMIAVRVKNSDTKTLQALHSRTRAIAPHARIDTHEEWLRDLLRFTGALQLAALVLVLVIGLTTVTAVAGAVRARMKIHRAEVEILHLMGASDSYITRQFQRHSVLLALRGGGVGALCAVAMIGIIGMIAGEMGVAVLPEFHLHSTHWAGLAAVPLCIAAIALFTARRTVLRTLTEMP